MQEVLESLQEDFDLLINELTNIYDSDELYRICGRLYELYRLIKRLEGATNA